MLPGSAILRGLITLPLTVSYLIIGMGLLVLFNWAGVPKSLLAMLTGGPLIEHQPPDAAREPVPIPANE